MRCAVTFTKIIQHGEKHLQIFNGQTDYPNYKFIGSSTRLRAAPVILSAGTYTLTADADGVTCKVYTYINERAAGIFPASGEGTLPYTFTLPEARAISVDFAFAGWGDTAISPEAVQNAAISEGNSTDVWETVVLHPNELADSDTITCAINSKTTITLKIFPTFEAWQFCEKSVTYVRVIDLDRNSDRMIFRGRVTEIIDSLNESGTLYQDIICVSALDFLEDTSLFLSNGGGYLVNPSDPTKGLIPAKIIGEHNSAVGNDVFRQFLYEITGNADYAKGGTIYGSRYSVFSAMMTDGNLRKYVGGGVLSGNYTMEFRENFAGDSNTILIAEKFGQNVDTAILIGENLRSIRIEKALQDAVYTQVLAISGVNSDGKRESARSTNDEMYAKYGGGRELIIVNDDIKCTAPMYTETDYSYARSTAYTTMMAALEEFARQEAKSLSETPMKLTISALDLADMGYTGYERFEVGNSHPVVCPPLGLYGAPMRITALKKRLCDGRIEQITIETSKRAIRSTSSSSSSSLSSMISRLNDLNQQVSDSEEEQIEIMQTVVTEQNDGVKIKKITQNGYGSVHHDANTLYIIDDDGKKSMALGDDPIVKEGGGGGTIETAAVLSSGQMTEWAPAHDLVPTWFRGNAAVYYGQPPAKIIIQGQRATFGGGAITKEDIMSEIAFEFRDGTRQKLVVYFHMLYAYQEEDFWRMKLGVKCYDITGAAETFLGSAFRDEVFKASASAQIGMILMVSELYANPDLELAPRYGVMLAVKDGNNAVQTASLPTIAASDFTGDNVDFGSAAERGFASGIARKTEPSG